MTTFLDVRGTFAYTLLQEQGLSDQQIAVELGVKFIPQEEEAHAELLRVWETPKQVANQLMADSGNTTQAAKNAAALSKIRVVVRNSPDLEVTEKVLDALYASLI